MLVGFGKRQAESYLKEVNTQYGSKDARLVNVAHDSCEHTR